MKEIFKKLSNPYKLTILSLLVILAADFPGGPLLFPVLGLVLASVADAALNYALRKRAFFTDSTVISTLIMLGILDPTSYAVAIVPALLVVAKHISRALKFPFPLANPAGSVLLLVFFFQPQLELWWANSNLVLLGLLGTLVALSIRKLYISLSFLVTWTAVALALIHPFPLGLHHYPFFLAFYMLTEPKTTPVRVKEQILFGVSVALMEHLFAIAGLPSSALLSLFVATFTYRGIPLLKAYFGKNRP